METTENLEAVDRNRRLVGATASEPFIHFV